MARWACRSSSFSGMTSNLMEISSSIQSRPRLYVKSTYPSSGGCERMPYCRRLAQRTFFQRSTLWTAVRCPCYCVEDDHEGFVSHVSGIGYFINGSWRMSPPRWRLFQAWPSEASLDLSWRLAHQHLTATPGSSRDCYSFWQKEAEILKQSFWALHGQFQSAGRAFLDCWNHHF